MTTKTRASRSTFDHLLATMAALYETEVARLVDVYRTRILEGEFSGHTSPPNDHPRYMHLEEEFQKSHPWLASRSGRLVVEAASRWMVARELAMTNPKTEETLSEGLEYWPGDMAAECLAHDVLAVAAARGWVKRMRFLGDDEIYVLRVA